MTVVRAIHEDHGAEFATVGGRDLPRHYGRPARAHRAVRNVVGVTEMAYGVLVVAGEDRVDFVDNAVSNVVPTADGEGVYALLLDPQGGVRADLSVYNAGERLLLFTPPGVEEAIAEDWREKTFIQDVSIDVASRDFGVFGVHGPKATEKIASVLNHASAPDGALSFVRGRMHDEGVTVIRGDGLAGEEGYEVVCDASVADVVYETLLHHGLNATPFGLATWETLTLEAGTPLFQSELSGRIPNVAGLRNAVDYEKGCFVGQEVVSRVENRGQPSQRLVGLHLDAVPEPGATVRVEDGGVSESEDVEESAGDDVGEVTRAAYSPSLDRPTALAFVDFSLDEGAALTVEVDGGPAPAECVSLPFVEGSERSARLPDYGAKQ